MELKGNYLDVAFMNDFQNAVLSLYFAMNNVGYPTLNITYEEAYKGFSPKKIKDLFNSQEQKMAMIDSIADWVNPHSGSYLWERTNGAIFNKINRWIEWMNFNQKIIKKEIQKSQYLTDKNGEEIFDKNGEKILTYEGYFKEVI